jgi:Ca-activated chloride channel family protein
MSATQATANAPVQILLQPLRAGLCAGTTQQFEVLVRLQAADLPPPPADAKPRSPHALAVVIDRSGSMQGKPLAEAQRCAEFVVSRLAATDVLALVQFDNRVERLWPAVPLRDGASVRAAIQRIEAGGTTDLHGGWVHGADSLTDVAGEGLKRVILLSDGCANEGVTDTAEITKQCAQWAARGISTSTYGLGNGFNEDLMVAMARAGGGNHYYGDTANDLMEPFERELDLISRLVLRRLTLRVHAADGVQVSMMNLLERAADGGWHLVDLAAGAEAWALLSVRVAADRVMDAGTLAEVLRVELSAQLPDGAPATIPLASLQLPVLTAGAYTSLAEDELVMRRRSELEAAETLARIRALVAEGEWDQVERLLEAARKKYASNPWVTDVVAAMSALATQRDDSRLMKEMAYFQVSANARLAASCESLEVNECADIPSFLKRKARQGKA